MAQKNWSDMSKAEKIAIFAVALVGIFIIIGMTGDPATKSSDNDNSQTLPVADKPANEPADKVKSFEPIKLSGSGQQMSEKFELDRGLYRATITHDGSEHFSMWLLDSGGNKVELLVNDIGPFNGSKAVTLASINLYALDVSADGNWTIEITK